MKERTLNFRKLKKDFSPSAVKDGRNLFDEGSVDEARITQFDSEVLRLTGRVLGNYENTYECEVEIDRMESEIIDSNCDCPHPYDCQHIAATLFNLEARFDEILVSYSKEANLEEFAEIDEEEKEELLQTIQKAESSVKEKRGKEYQDEVLREYVGASFVLGHSPFFLPAEELDVASAELALIFTQDHQRVVAGLDRPEIQIALRLPYRSKPLHIAYVQEFLDSVRYREPIYLAGKHYLFSPSSFVGEGQTIMRMMLDHARFPDGKTEKQLRTCYLDTETFGSILARVSGSSQTHHAMALEEEGEGDGLVIPGFYCGSLEVPLRLAKQAASLRIELETLETPPTKIFLKPMLVVEDGKVIEVDEAVIYRCARPGFLYEQTYYRMHPSVKRSHLNGLSELKNLIVPEPLFGSFIENSLSELMSYAQVANREAVDSVVTLPYTGKMEAACDVHYLDGELEASVSFIYDDISIPASSAHLSYEEIEKFVTKEGILARNLTREKQIIDRLFQGFVFQGDQGVFCAKTEKKIVEFMTEVIPANQDVVTFHCPENLLEQFIYDETTFVLKFRKGKRADCYEVELQVDGHLKGVTVDLLWECIGSKKAYIELIRGKRRGRGKSSGAKLPKILVLDLEKIQPIVRILDEIGLSELENYKEERPLWSLASISEELFEDLPIQFSMTKELRSIQKQILGEARFSASPVPKEIKATLREYQKEGVQWLERLRSMHLNGILADDMGLGKTLQAIIAVTQLKKKDPEEISLVVSPTSLTYNWKGEIAKFNPKLKVLLVDGTPTQRKKLLKKVEEYDVVVTSYSLLQKDIEFYEKVPFGYAILDEAQHIKNRGTRNAKSVKRLQAKHRLILTGTPIENSLDELWSLFDFLMPGLLSSYERFSERYIRSSQGAGGKNLDLLRAKVTPFVLRRMKSDVLKELPPVSEIVYHCHLSKVQKDLYTSYAQSAREELSRLVKKEGFDKVQIHVLATLTRLKQICCHPAIFAKESAEAGDSAKYDMLMELLRTLMEGNHKTVIFSQYTRMLRIMQRDLDSQGIPYSYLDGSSKNRLEIVNQFNEDPNIPLFLVSLKAGGTGLNLVGADTVVLYDFWWNPAVEEQAKDRVYRIGQKKNVSFYKLVTLGSIEEKILQMQEGKKDLAKKLIRCDDEAMSKLTWDEVLELLQT